MEREDYKLLEMEIINFESEDIITSSTCPSELEDMP